jgi:hypothetical protein
MKEALRVATALTFGAVVGAIDLAVLLVVLVNLDSGRPLFTDASLQGLAWMSLAFCLFTLPIAWSFGVPVYLLFRRFHLLRVWVCAVTGAMVGIAVPYSCRLMGATVSLEWHAILWFGVSGAAAGAVMGALLRREETPPKPVSQA